MNEKTIVWGLGVASIVLLPVAVGGCHRRASAAEQSTPAPSSSVIQLGIEIGSCGDVETCTRECEGGSADRCRRLAMSYSFGKSVERDEAHAAALLEKACGMGDPSSCLFAGHMHEYGRGVPKNEATAATYYEQSCRLKWVGGCYNSAVMYEQGRGVAADVGKARELYQLACTAGSTTACGKVQEMTGLPLSNR